MTARRPRCTCRRLDHQPTDCPYRAGCSGCLCGMADHYRPHLTWCGPCSEYTVHPDQHQHLAALVAAQWTMPRSSAQAPPGSRRIRDGACADTDRPAGPTTNPPTAGRPGNHTRSTR